MQDYDISKFPNSSGWFVKHNADDQLWDIVSAKGHKMVSRFTAHKIASQYLYTYLQDLYNKDLRKQAKLQGS